MNRFYIRFTFIVIMIFLPLQYVLVGIVGNQRSEPWPTFVFPGFKSIYHSKDATTIEAPIFEIFDKDGNEYELKPAEVLRGIPLSHHSAIMRYQFKRYSIDRENNIKYLSSEGMDWLLNQLEENEIDNQNIHSIQVVWYNKNFKKLESNMILADRIETDRIILKRVE